MSNPNAYFTPVTLRLTPHQRNVLTRILVDTVRDGHPYDPDRRSVAEEVLTLVNDGLYPLAEILKPVERHCLYVGEHVVWYELHPLTHSPGVYTVISAGYEPFTTASKKEAFETMRRIVLNETGE